MKDKIETIDKQPLRGMRDFLPSDWIFRKKLMETWEKAAEINGFVRYETPIVEPLSLLERKSGEEISEQIYNFEDKSGRKIALRPEITPSMVRIVSKNREAFPAQGKVYSIGQCFRYERASLGRKREHFQWNIDIIGEESVVAEAYLLKTAINALQKLGFDKNDYKIHVNNRQLVSDFLTSLEMDENQIMMVMRILDKKDKVSKDVFHEMLREILISEEQIFSLSSFMEAKSIEDIEKFGLEESQSIKQMNLFLSYCKALSITDYIIIDTSIVRGLAYYTGIVFEAFDTNRKFRAIFGGGRYNHLFEKLTGQSSAAVGIGFGDVVIEELYKDKFPNRQTQTKIDLLLGGYSENTINDLLTLSQSLVNLNITSDCDFKSSSLKKFLSKADKRRACIIGYIGEREQVHKEILLKNMNTSEQIISPLDSDTFSMNVKRLLEKIKDNE